jgi:hypothetical protein
MSNAEGAEGKGGRVIRILVDTCISMLVRDTSRLFATIDHSHRALSH